MPVTFPVSDVKPYEPLPLKTIEVTEAVGSAMERPVEAAGANLTIQHVDQTNGFLQTCLMSYDAHRPLCLSPDDVWLAIAQGFAQHVNANAEALRSRFVQHEGKKELEVVRNGFVKGSAENDWPDAFGEFADQIAEHIGDHQRRLLVADFTTTGPIGRAASNLVLMDAMSSYFAYTMMTCCGIPSVTLLGTADDWSNIRARAAVLAEYQAGPWIAYLDEVLEFFTDAFKGSADPKFWQSFCKQSGGSGGPFVTGYVNAFFPYLRNKKVNPYANGTRSPYRDGPRTDDIPGGLSVVPFQWKYYGQDLPMDFLGGFVGTHQDEGTQQVRPVLGWAVGDRLRASVLPE